MRTTVIFCGLGSFMGVAPLLGMGSESSILERYLALNQRMNVFHAREMRLGQYVLDLREAREHVQRLQNPPISVRSGRCEDLEIGEDVAPSKQKQLLQEAIEFRDGLQSLVNALTIALAFEWYHHIFPEHLELARLTKDWWPGG